MSYTLHIKNMVCSRCIRVVRDELTALKYTVVEIELGRVVLHEEPDLGAVDKVLETNGFERLQDKKSKLIEEIKSTIRNHLHSSEMEGDRLSLRALIGDALHVDYNYLSTLFSSTEGLTIERYYILQKIERVKELLKYDELTLSEIAYRLGYSSVAHLSSQFKRTTGLTPTQFTAMMGGRKPIDNVGTPDIS